MGSFEAGEKIEGRKSLVVMSRQLNRKDVIVQAINAITVAYA